MATKVDFEKICNGSGISPTLLYTFCFFALNYCFELHLNSTVILYYTWQSQNSHSFPECRFEVLIRINQGIYLIYSSVLSQNVVVNYLDQVWQFTVSTQPSTEHKKCKEETNAREKQWPESNVMKFSLIRKCTDILQNTMYYIYQYMYFLIYYDISNKATFCLQACLW